ncbi:hypothetical protein DIC66_20100 [Rhodoferax lacus]|uniref:Glycosyltransferase n=1 Tax=Rhodoferax lacus TaxID=2184758 RepID=A0A3E1R7B3_9BURK|nr:glycosyltransferase [Rhodoferax lacus]RFO95133.1 hypothetical protein DIC66_20100 [Rhodoferax lacus]
MISFVGTMPDHGDRFNMGLPDAYERHVIQSLASSVISRYEAHALAGLEHRILAAADAVVLVSSVEAAQLRESLHVNLSVKVTTIPPPMPQAIPSMPSPTISRFVFVGSDSLLQNRRTIEVLVDIWLRLRPAVPLHLYGRQKGAYALVPGLIVHGFVDNIAEAYGAGSVMLAPSFVDGGVKSKVLEAFAHGIVVVGNLTTFEGIGAPTNSLVLGTEDMEKFVRSPQLQLSQLVYDAQVVIAAARENHSPAKLSVQWRAVVWPDRFSIEECSLPVRICTPPSAST